MAWLARSIADSLRLGDDDGTVTSNANHEEESEFYDVVVDDDDENEEEDQWDNQGRGVKEDLSELKETLTRQLWGVASFLAPPPPPPPPLPAHPSYSKADRSVTDRDGWEMSGQSGSGDVSDEDVSEFNGDSGIRSDFTDIMGEFRNGISNSSNVVQFRSEDEIGEAVGVTEEVLAFARNIAHHPETWLDFPSSEDEEMNDFNMSDAQYKHVLTVELLAPRLRALRIELCPAHMSEGYFWKVYLVLLHSRLNKHDAELLSTPQMIQARAMWMQELQKRTKPEEPDWFGRSTRYTKESIYSLHEDFNSDSIDDDPAGNRSLRTRAFEPTVYSATTDFETEKHPVVSTEIQVIDKSVIEEEKVTKTRDKEFAAGSSYKMPIQDYDDDEDDWLKENSELDGYDGAGIMVGNEEDVSFSDLEDDYDCTVPIKSKIVSKDLDKLTGTS